MSLHIRPAHPDDGSVLSALIDDQMGYSYPPAQVTEVLAAVQNNEREVVLVAELGGQAVGFVHAEEYRLLYAPLMVNVLGLAVAQEVEGRGIGTRLMEAMEDWARAKGASTVRLVSGDSRTGAHDFYARRGYVARKSQVNFRKELN